MIAKVTVDDGIEYFWFWCQGCKSKHVIPVSGPQAWGFNYDIEKPTLTPSIKIEYHHTKDDGVHVSFMCHSFVTNGQIQYLGDCTHALAGQTIPLPELS